MVLVENPGLKVEVVDSQTSMGAMGFMAIEAARAARQGAGMEEVLGIIQDMKGRVKSICGIDTLKYLIRSGRAPKTAYLGELVGIKPIVGGVKGDGLTEMLDKVRGKQKSFERLVEMVGKYTDSSKPLHVMVHYTNAIEDGKTVLEMVRAKYNCVESYLTFQSPLSGGHTGPITVISFYD
jgi:DegV family protein with EDD domain